MAAPQTNLVVGRPGAEDDEEGTTDEDKEDIRDELPGGFMDRQTQFDGNTIKAPGADGREQTADERTPAEQTGTG